MSNLRRDVANLKDTFARLASQAGGEAAKTVRGMRQTVASQVGTVAGGVADAGSELASSAKEHAKTFASELEAMARPAIGRIQMTGLDELKTTVRRNKLLGMWAAGKLGLAGRDAEAYADALAVGTVDPERSDVFSKVRKDFDAAGVIQSDEQILRVMNELMLQAASQMPATQGGAADAAAVMLARNLTSR
jgi:hypothetical protein